MKRLHATKIISAFLRKSFNDFVFVRCPSDFAHTFLIVADGEEYVIKLVEYKNVVSKIRHDKKHIQNIISLSEHFNKHGRIRTISVSSFLLGPRYSILLLQKEKISKIKIEKTAHFKKIGQAIATFHKLGDSFEFQKLPWNHFPPHFVVVLKRHNRWNEIKGFLEKNRKHINSEHNVTCHNDIHDGNIFISNKKIIFLDIDDICKGSCFNDLGMVIANFTKSENSKVYLLKAIERLLIGYGEDYSSKNILRVILFALRKLYFTEAYFLYAWSAKKTPINFVFELRKRQRILNSLLAGYLKKVERQKLKHFLLWQFLEYLIHS